MDRRRRALKVGVLAALLAGCALFYRAGDVDGAGARRLVSEGALLVDVRTPEEFADGHLPGAVNIPVQDLDRRIGEIGPKDKPVVLYCRSGRRSSNAAGMLKRAGYTTVHDLGAMSRW